MTRRRSRRRSPRLPARSENTSTNQEVTVQREEHVFSGPLPAPETLRGYDEILPGTAERIIRMAEREQTNAHEAGLLALRETAAGNARGQIFGGVVALAALGTAGFLGYLGHSIAAGIVGGTTVVGLVTVFVTGRRYPNA